MKLIADENIDADIIEWLRSQEMDVLSVMELMRSAPDVDILARANGELRIILTKDMDFGELVFRERLASAGVILLRFKKVTADARLSLVQQYWPEVKKHAPGHFLVLSQSRLRVRSIGPQ